MYTEQVFIVYTYKFLLISRCELRCSLYLQGSSAETTIFILKVTTAYPNQTRLSNLVSLNIASFCSASTFFFKNLFIY